MRGLATIEDPGGIRRILTPRGFPSEPVPPALAQPPAECVTDPVADTGARPPAPLGTPPVSWP